MCKNKRCYNKRISFKVKNSFELYSFQKISQACYSVTLDYTKIF